MFQIHARVGILGPPMGFDLSGPSKWGCWAKSHDTHNAPIFSGWGVQCSPARKIPYFLSSCLWEQGTVNDCMFQRASFRRVFGDAFNTDFGVSHGFVTPIKGCRVTDFYLTGWF